MSSAKSFTAKDACAALGVSRSRLHQWAQLPPFSERPTRERSARRFSRADMLTFAVMHTMEDAFGVKSKDLGGVSAKIHEYLNAPQVITFEELVFIPLETGDAQVVEGQAVKGAGWVIDMAKERERVDVYLGVRPPQREFPLMTELKSSRQ